MADDTIKLGQLIGPNQVRDATHIAVAPVIASERLSPGDHIGLTVGEGDVDMAGFSATPIGIVDPFLKTRVMPGERFWLWLYPNTVTGMRHHWLHPAFEGRTAVLAAKDDAKKAAAKAWLEGFANEAGITFDETIEAGREAAERGEYCFGNDTPDVFWKDLTEFWNNIEIYAGITVPESAREQASFRCAC